MGIATAILLVGAASANAAARFASPTGTPSAACAQAAPCDIVTAVNSAAANDDVTIEPGTYGSPTPLTTIVDDVGHKLTIHGQAGQPRPVINTTASYGVNLSGGSTLSDVEIIDSAPGAYGFKASAAAASIDHVYVYASGASGWACYPNATMVDSVCWDSGSNGTAVTELVLADVTGILHSDTLIASGSGGYAIGLYGSGSATMTINMTNTIARGAGADVYAHAFAGSSAVLTADHSNYATFTNGAGGGTITVPAPGSGTNQTAAPVFVAAATGDFHQLAASPTVDAGTDSALNGTTDLDGSPRQIGANSDIGAYEFVPKPTCNALSAATKFGTTTTIQLHCQDAAGAAVTYAVASSPSHGTLGINPSSGLAGYIPSAGYSGPDSFSYTGTSSHGTAAAATVAVTVGPEAQPVILGLLRKGRTVTFTLNEPAQVTLTLTRKHHKTIKRHSSGSAGANKIRLPKKLAPGKYKVTLAATNAGGSAKRRTLRFKIAK